MAFRYASRVIDWFEAPHEMLALPKYVSMPRFLQDKMIRLHAFSLQIDLFLNSDYSFKTTWTNPKKDRLEDLYRLPGQMSFEGQTLRGVFEYCIDPATGVCYHRCFKELTEGALLGDYLENKDFDYLVDYPELSKESAKAPKIYKIAEKALEVTIDPLKRISFVDVGVSFCLFRLN